MNALKKAQVDRIRDNTAYPAYRGTIGIITTILMTLAGLQAIGAIIIAGAVGTTAHNGFAGFVVFLIGLAFAVLAFFLAKVWNEAAQILVDIGDSVLDSNPGVSAMSVPSALSAPLTPQVASPLS